MNLSFACRSSVELIGFLAVLMSSFNHALAAEEVTPDSQGLRLTVDQATGDYKIAQHGSNLKVLMDAGFTRATIRNILLANPPRTVIWELHTNGW